MEYLRLGLVGLTSAEDSLIATLFRLHRVDQSFIWTLATVPPYDALLVDVSSEERHFKHNLGPVTKVLKLGGQDCEGPGMAARPIRSDLLVRWLNSIEVEILHSSRDPFASTTLESQVWRASSSPRSGHPSHPPESDSRPTAELPSGARVKLLRWPTGALLGGDVNRIRMATMLSRRALSVQDLSAATRVAVEQCEEFIRALHKANLFEVLSPAESPPRSEPGAAAATVQAMAAPAPTARGMGLALLRSIRQRFGI